VIFPGSLRSLFLPVLFPRHATHMNRRILIVALALLLAFAAVGMLSCPSLFAVLPCDDCSAAGGQRRDLAMQILPRQTVVGPALVSKPLLSPLSLSLCVPSCACVYLHSCMRACVLVLACSFQSACQQQPTLHDLFARALELFEKRAGRIPRPTRHVKPPRILSGAVALMRWEGACPLCFSSLLDWIAVQTGLPTTCFFLTFDDDPDGVCRHGRRRRIARRRRSRRSQSR